MVNGGFTNPHAGNNLQASRVTTWATGMESRESFLIIWIILTFNPLPTCSGVVRVSFLYVCIYIYMGIVQYCLHNRMTSLRKFNVPFTHTIASFRGSMSTRGNPQFLSRTPSPAFAESRRYFFCEIQSSFREHHRDLSRKAF